MISFIVSAVILVLISMLFIVPTLRKRNYAFSDEYDDLNVSIAKERLSEIKLQFEAGEITEQIYQQMRDELESTLALDLSAETQSNKPSVAKNNKYIAVIMALIIPVAAAGVYYKLGDFAAATGSRFAETVIPAGDNHQQMTLEEAVGKLEHNLAEDPQNPDGWFMLAKTYMAMKHFQKAVTAYEKVIELVGEEPEVLLRLTDALAMTEGGKLTGAAKPVMDKVIALIPNNTTVLWMAGTAENQQGNYAKALSFWYRLYPQISQNKEARSKLDILIQSAEGQLPKAQVTELKESYLKSPPESQAADNGAEIIVTVELDPKLKDKVKPSDTLFIFAKAMQGPPMPLAAVKKTVSALPLTVSLNDAMAMMPQMKLSNFEQVKVSAVISKSGQPGTQAGDLFVEISSVNVKAQEKIKLIINQVK